MAIAAIVFGALTILSGGRGLFGSAEARAALGSTVPFVLWFNFLAGFVYIIAGAGLLLQWRWAVCLSLLIAISTSLIFAAFGFHVIQGGVFEMRTVGALTLRALFWVAVAMVAMHAQKKHVSESFPL
ncbi:MAG: hypothetical protein HKP58_10540 [Desulfatitalea sp.]|nr:hypothetical protein [Desulfatitalea sp.]NNK00838.1 hypothetical protein [Desulfatitalea sp.]